jgi:multiple sugar transport system ATP-binding protein
VLVGPSGCGKSTTLRMIAGLEDITGEIMIGGRVVNDLPPRKRNISMVFQNYALYPHMTCAKIWAFRLKIAGKAKPRSPSGRRGREILGLTPLLDRTPAELSGGQRQRVAMGRAIVRNPDVFLFDEPLSTSTPSCAPRCGPRSRSCTRRSRPPWSMSPMTRSRR